MTNQRQDFLHQTSRRLMDRFGFIKIENLNVCGMLRAEGPLWENHYLAKSISDSGWSRFGTFLDYKGQWHGSYIERVDRFFPSSMTCWFVAGLIKTCNCSTVSGFVRTVTRCTTEI